LPDGEGAQQIGPDVFTTPQQVAHGFFLLGRGMNAREATGATEDCQLRGIATVGFDPVAAAARNQGGAMTSHGTPSTSSARCNSNPHGPAS
jgi:hypothetical protein